MRANKRAIIGTAVITILSLVACIILHCLGHEYGLARFIYDLSLACFGSALLGVVVAYSAYDAEKRRSMVMFWFAGQRNITALRKIKHLRMDPPDELIALALNENRNFLPSTVARDNLRQWYLEHKLCIPGNDEEFCSVKLKEYKEYIDEIMDRYTAFGNLDNHELDSGYSELDFLIANKTIRLPAYNNIYRKIKDLQNSCRQADFQFKQVRNGAGHYGLALQEIRKLDQMLYIDDGIHIFASLCDNLSYDLETFRSKVYRCKPEYIKPECVDLYIDFGESQGQNGCN